MTIIIACIAAYLAFAFGLMAWSILKAEVKEE